ncbi:MAG: MFS transporter [Gammaproteobacteria bacterium]|nr:MFS transporter [Gammaproteobacteria bacterium]MBI5617237.1 MFS transporter [Gammaproteobacteria bacterium]
MMSGPETPRARFLVMFTLVVAGEMIFSLPFHLPRYFRPSFLAAYGLGNADLGDVFAAYGLTAMAAYFPGGVIADRFPARRLMSVALVATAAGGCYLATGPGRLGMTLLYAWWGATTILLFWAAMMRATRTWGGTLAQGRAFGILDGGRGLAAAAFATFGVAIFSRGLAGGASRVAALNAVVLFYTAVTFAAAMLAWWALRDDGHSEPASTRLAAGQVRAILGSRVVWLQALVVIAAYCGYKGLDNYALFVNQVLGLDETHAAAFAAASAYLRPVGAVLAGYVADRLGVARVVSGLFLVLALVYIALSVLATAPSPLALVFANLLVTYFGVFALRGVYFALLEESRVPHVATGAAVGVISLVGYTPDVFFASVAGRILDAAPGAVGHGRYFLLLAAIAGVGLAAAVALRASGRELARTG